MRRARGADLDALGAMLLERNVASVLSLEDEDDSDPDGDAPGYHRRVAGYSHEPVRFVADAHVGFAQQALRSCGDYAYQTRYAPGWRRSAAKAWIDALTTAASTTLLGADAAPRSNPHEVGDLPGMDDTHRS